MNGSFRKEIEGVAGERNREGEQERRREHERKKKKEEEGKRACPENLKPLGRS